MTIGQRVKITSYGETITGVVTQIGHYTGKPSQMRRDDTGQLRAIIPPGNCERA